MTFCGKTTVPLSVADYVIDHRVMILKKWPLIWKQAHMPSELPYKPIKLTAIPDGKPIRASDLLVSKEWPTEPITIVPQQGDVYYELLMTRPSDVVLLFLRGLFEYEKMLAFLQECGGTHADVHMELVIANSASLQAVLTLEQRDWTLKTPKDCFRRAIIRQRYLPNKRTRKEPPLIRVIWDNELPATVRQAKQRFLELTQQGHRALSVAMRPVKELPLDDEEIIFVKPKLSPVQRLEGLPPERLTVLYRRFSGLYNKPISFII